MPQSSLMTWLSKPAAVKEPPHHVEESPKAAHPPSLQPTTQPPPASPDRDAATENTHPRQFALPTHSKPLPDNVELRSCTRDDIPHLKRLTGLLLPIPYPDKFYREIVEDPLTNNITLLALWHDDPEQSGKQKGRLIGAIRCRLLAHPPASTESNRTGAPMLYLSTLMTLSPYRRHGVAIHLLREMTCRAVDNYGVCSVGAHVWEANVDALEWYRKRGFREVGRESDYYRRLDPSTAIVVQRDVGVMDLV